MVLTLLAKPIAIHMRISPVEIWKPSLKRLFSGLCLALSHLSLGLQVGFHKLFEKFIGRGRSEGSWSRSRSRSTRNNGCRSGSRSAAAVGRSSSKLIFTGRWGVTVRTAASTCPGYLIGWEGRSKGKLLLLSNGLADPLGLELLEL